MLKGEFDVTLDAFTNYTEEFLKISKYKCIQTLPKTNSTCQEAGANGPQKEAFICKKPSDSGAFAARHFFVGKGLSSSKGKFYHLSWYESKYNNLTRLKTNISPEKVLFQ